MLLLIVNRACNIEQEVEEIEEDIEGDYNKPYFDTSDKEDTEFNNSIDRDVDQDDKNI
jgi:hypothetical protein